MPNGGRSRYGLAHLTGSLLLIGPGFGRGVFLVEGAHPPG